MANVHAAVKQIRKDAKRQLRNQTILSALKGGWRKLTRLTPSDSNQAKSLAQALVSKWDRAVLKGVVPRARANRKKARIASLLNRLMSQSR